MMTQMVSMGVLIAVVLTSAAMTSHLSLAQNCPPVGPFVIVPGTPAAGSSYCTGEFCGQTPDETLSDEIKASYSGLLFSEEEIRHLNLQHDKDQELGYCGSAEFSVTLASDESNDNDRCCSTNIQQAVQVFGNCTDSEGENCWIYYNTTTDEYQIVSSGTCDKTSVKCPNNGSCQQITRQVSLFCYLWSDKKYVFRLFEVNSHCACQAKAFVTLA